MSQNLPFERSETITTGKRANILRASFALFGLFAIATGSADVVFGTKLLVSSGAALGSAANDPWLDSQLRFLGAMWAGWGIMMLWTCRNLSARGDAFDLLCAILFVAGCGRAVSALLHPYSPTLLIFFIAVELTIAPLGVVLRRQMRSSSIGGRPGHR